MSKTMPSVILPLAVIATIAFANGCGDGLPSSPEARRSELDELSSESVSSSEVWVDQVIERTGPSSVYAMLLPENWNGDVVFYAHGFRDVAEPVNLPTADGVEEFRDALGALGYAFAYSSFDQNGYALKNGMQRIHQLRGLFNARFGSPRRSFLAGHSLGGGVVLALAERYGNQYAGALPMCGLVGGTGPQVDYVANVRVLFDLFYPGVLPGNAVSVPEDIDLNNDVILPALAAMQADPNGVFAISQIDQTPLPFANPAELVESALRALGFHARGIDNFLDLTHGHIPFDNSGTTYTGALPEPLLLAINAGVDRFTGDPAGENYENQYFTPTGELLIPVLTLHTSRDPVAPGFHETIYQEVVAASGRSDLLLQRTYDRFAHCGFTTEEMVEALTDLALWAETGKKPGS